MRCAHPRFLRLDATYHEAGREPIAGREALAAYFTRFFRDGPPWRFEVDEILVDGERAAVAYRFEISATQRMADSRRVRARSA